MQQHLGVTHISGRPVLSTLGLSTTSRSRDPPVTQPSFHTAPSPAATSGGGSVFVSAQGIHSVAGMMAPASVEDGKLFQTASWAAAQRCLCTLSRVPSPLGSNQPHHPSQISSSTTCGKQPTPHLTSQQATVGHLLLAQEPPTDGWPADSRQRRKHVVWCPPTQPSSPHLCA